ncbi:MAG: glycosyltransferase family 4 protein [Thermoleophilia bacterium]
MRVALVHHRVGLTGSLERYTAFLAAALLGLGVEVHLYTNPDASDLSACAAAILHGVRPLTAGGNRLTRAAERLSFARGATEALRRDRARLGLDVVDVSGTSAWAHDVVTVHAVSRAEQDRDLALVGPGIAAALRVELTPLLRPQVGVVQGIERRQLRPGRFRRVIAVTPEVRDDVMRVHGVPAAAIDVVPYPIDLARFADDTPADRRALGLPDDEPVLLFVGHDFERKGLGALIRALPGLEPRATLAVAGDGDRGPYEALARSLGVADRVRFLGSTARPDRLYRAADVFVLPTVRDVWGMTIVEAMAAGIPVVTTRGAGAASEVEAAEAGAVLPGPDPAALRDALARLLADPGARSAAGERGRRAAARFGTEEHARAVLATYERALRARQTRAA